MDSRWAHLSEGLWGPRTVERRRRLQQAPSACVAELVARGGALQQGVVDGQDNTLSVISASKLFEVQKHLSLTHHQLGVSTLLVSRTFWNSLSADEQRIATYAAYEATLAQRAAARSQAQADLDTLRRGGMQVHDLTPAERDRLRQRLRPVVDRFSATTDPAVVNDLLSAAARR